MNTWSHVILIIFRSLVNYCPQQLTLLNCNATVDFFFFK